MRYLLNNPIAALVTLLLVLCLTTQAYIFYRLNQMSAISQIAAPANTTSSATNAVVAPGFAPGFEGTIESISKNTIVVSVDGASRQLSFATGMEIFALGVAKPLLEYQKEMSDYNAAYVKLAADPEKNKAQIEALERPTVNRLTPLALSDFKAGDHVGVAVDGTNIVRLVKLPI